MLKVVEEVFIFDNICFSLEEELRPFFDTVQTVDKVYEDKSGEKWELVVNRDVFKLWRCPLPGTSLYKYKGSHCCFTVT